MNKFFYPDEGICPSNYQYAYDGGQKCCQHIYEDNEEYEYLQFNSHQCQNDISINCPFNEGCDDRKLYIIICFLKPNLLIL